jgi:chromosome partitioning protein
MIVIVGNRKGGVGKTTLAVQIALARQTAGRPVLLIDADRQGSAQSAATMRAEGGHTPPACGWQAATGAARPAGGHDDTIIDAGGRDDEALRRAFGSVQFVGGASACVDVVPDRHRRPDRPGAGSPRGQWPVPTACTGRAELADPGDNRDTAETVEALAGFPQFTVAEAIVRLRKAIANAMAHWPRCRRATAARSQGVRGNRAPGSNVFNVTEIAHGNHTAIKAE